MGAVLISVVTTPACLDYDGVGIDLGRDCEVHEDCTGFTPWLDLFYDERCNEAVCEDRRCTTRPKDGALPDDVDGDCSGPFCSNGSVVYLYSVGDSPPASECQVGRCGAGGGGSYVEFMPEGTVCSTGVCRMGTCVAIMEDAGLDAGDAGDAGAGDAGDGDAGDAGDGG